MAEAESTPENLLSANALSTESKGPVSLKFRNYTPHDPSLKKAILSSEDDASTVKKQILERFEALSNPDTNGQLSLAPRKPNWDLKRDVAKKLEKLDKKTQLAILELIKEKQEFDANPPTNVDAQD